MNVENRFRTTFALPAGSVGSVVFAMWIAVGLLFGAVGAANAQAAGHPAQEKVESVVGEVLEILATRQDEIAADPSILDDTVDQLIVPNLDFSTMTKLTVGKSWRKANEGQRTELVSEFKNFLLNAYSSALREFGGENIEFQPYKKNKRDDRAVVDSVFVQGANKVPVTYKLHNRKGPWVIYDIVVSDLSLVLQYKASFSNEIERSGIQGLIDLLKERNGT